MKKQLIFNEEEITVFKVTYPDAREIEYWIGNGEETFSTAEQPRLTYKSLKKKLKEYIQEKERTLASEVREQDLEDYREEDIHGFWDSESEGF